MTPERWQQVKSVFDQAVELAPDQRPSFLDRACYTDHSLRREVESLLSSDGEARSGFLELDSTRVTLLGGTKLGEYEVQSLLSSGGMGVVYRARDERLGRDVAIKVLPPFFALDRERLRRFEQEARAAAALNHPNILAVFQLGTYEGSPYLVSELLEGESLRARVKRGPIPLQEALDYARQIVRGLAAAHKKGIVHRDLKPENLFLTQDGQVKILDFGLAKQTHRGPTAETKAASLATEAGVVMGTVGYMSPEQVRGQAADFRADIFAFGAILYEMLSGRRAFTGESSADVASAILKEEPPLLSKSVSKFPKALESFLKRCLKKNPEQRFQSVEQLTVALREVAAIASRATAVTQYSDSLNWILGTVSRRIALAGLAATIILSAVAGAVYFRSREPSIDSLAVMPFAGKGMDSGVELGDGLTSGLVDSLSQIPNLRVISRNSVSHYKGKEIEPRAIGRELHVQAVLTGTLAWRGDNLVLDAELVNASDNTHLWGQQYTFNPASTLTLQAELAQGISTRLRPHLTDEAKTKLANPGTSNPEAYALYVKGRYAADGFYAQDSKKALVYFQQAVEKDPAYPQAHAGVGEAYVLLAHYRSVPLREGVQKGRAAANRALELDGNLAEAHCVLGAGAYMVWEFKEMEDETRRCVELNPNLPIAHQYYSFALSTLGRMDQALAEIERARELDPVSFTNNLFVALNYFWLRDYDRTIEESLKILETDPNQTELRNYLAKSYVMKREYDKAAKEFEKAFALAGKDYQAEALRGAYGKDGLRGLLKAQIELWSHPEKPDDYDPEDIAANYSMLGDREKALLWLDRAYADNDKIPNGNLLDLKVEPFLDNIRTDPRYNAFLRRMGFPP